MSRPGPGLRGQLPLLLLVFWVGFNLRDTMLSVPPVLDLVRASERLSYASSGLLTSIPLLALGLAAVPAALLVRRLGARAVVGLGLALGALGALVRALPGGGLPLFLGTALMGVGIAACQPGLPVFIQSRFGSRVQSASVTLTLGITVGEVIAAATTASLLLPRIGGWAQTMVFWGGLMALAALAWVLVGLGGRNGSEAGRGSGGLRDLGRTLFDRRLWPVYVLFGGQSLVFFSTNTWVPTALGGGAGRGLTSLTLAVLNGVMIPVDLLLIFSGRTFATRRWFYLLSSALTLLGGAGWLLSGARPALLWAALIGAGVALDFAGLLAYPAMVARPQRVAAISASMLTVGYAAAFCGPFLGGVALDLGGGRESPFIPIVAAAALMVVCSLLAPVGRDPGAAVGSGAGPREAAPAGGGYLG